MEHADDALVTSLPNNGVNVFPAKLLGHWGSPASSRTPSARVARAIAFFTGANMKPDSHACGGCRR